MTLKDLLKSYRLYVILTSQNHTSKDDLTITITRDKFLSIWDIFKSKRLELKKLKQEIKQLQIERELILNRLGKIEQEQSL